MKTIKMGFDNVSKRLEESTAAMEKYINISIFRKGFMDQNAPAAVCQSYYFNFFPLVCKIGHYLWFVGF